MVTAPGLTEAKMNTVLRHRGSGQWRKNRVINVPSWYEGNLPIAQRRKLRLKDPYAGSM